VFHSPKRPFLVALPIALALLLLSLALLQYRWVGELGANERRRMESTLRVSLAAMAREMNEEIARGAAALNVGPDVLETLEAPKIVEEWNRTSAGAIAPRMFSAVHVVRTEGDEPSLYRLDRTTGALELRSWDGAPQRLRQLVMEDMQSGSLEHRRWLDDELGAIVTRILDLPTITTGSSVDVNEIVRQMGSIPRTRLAGYLIVHLDLQIVRERLMPELVARYVPDADYRIALMRTRDGAPIYASGAGSFDSPDARADVLPDSVMPVVLTAGGRTRGEVRTYTTGRGALTVAVDPRGGTAVITPDSTPSPWELRAIHRAGSVDRAVARMQRRNLLLGSSILLVLAAGIGVAFLHARRAEALARQQMEFVSVMSHELRTPIAIVNAAAENLSRGLVSNRERGREYGDVIQREMVRLSAMIEQVLEFARARGKKLSGSEAVDLGAVASDAVQALEPLVAEAGGRIELRPEDDVPTLVKGDAEALGRAVRNLVGNALKHSGEGPQITVSTSTTASEAMVSVSDRGPGIPIEERAHLTEPFFRGSRAIDQQIPGSGLGLSIVQRIVEDHDGRLLVESADGGGSRFTICLRRISS
jgi:two-component system, OmpR family, sensor histidine kinase SenX3